MTHTLTHDTLALPVAGLNLRPGTLHDQISGAPATLLVFLRHFGCIFCRETVKDLREIAEKHPSYPPVLFFYQGSVEEGQAFFRRLWAEARAVADPDKRFYDALGIQRGGMREMFGPEVFACGMRAAAKGHFIGQPVGDPWVMPGLFLVDAQGAVVWSHDFRHAGDHPDFLSIADRLPQTS